MSFLISLSSCATQRNSNVEYTENKLFNDALRAVEKERYFDAIEQFEELETRFPYGEYGEIAKLNLIYSYYQSKDYASVIGKANQHIRYYPQSEYQDYVLYLRGLAQFYINIGYARRYLPLNISEQDLSSLASAFKDFQTLVNLYPNSDYAADSKARMIYIRNLLAEEKANIAKYYLKGGAYIAAINRAEEILQTFPNTPATADALAIKSVAYAKLNQDKLAERYKQLLIKNFPDYSNLTSNNEISLKTQKDNTDWLEIMSFGLLPL